MRAHKYLERITPFGFSGACLVGLGDEIVLNAGYGLAAREEGVPNTAHTVFSLGSVTKQFTAAAILKLEEQGKLGADDPIGRFIDAPADKAGITLHQLLTHTAGLPVYTGDDFEPAGRDETVAKILAAPLRFPPGSDFAYSNAGYSLLAAIVELASGEGYEEFLRASLFAPAGLEATGYRLPDWDARVIAHWYAGDVDNATPLDKTYPSWNLMGNGDVLSTTADMFHWHRALLHDAVLTAASREKLFTRHAGDYGYGWRVTDGERGRLVEHGGASSYGCSCTFRRYLDEDLVLVLFCNASFGPSPLAPLVQDRLVAAAFGEAVPLPPRAERRPASASVAGVYALPSGGRLRVAGSAIAAEGQDAIDELAFGGSSHVRLNDRAALVVSAVLSGADSPLRDEVAGDPERLERYRRLIGELHGDVTVAGTMPSHLPGTCVTHVGGGDEGIALYWRDGRLLGLGEGDPAARYELSLARADRGYLACDLSTENVVRVEFENGRLALTSGGRTVRAERL